MENEVINNQDNLIYNKIKTKANKNCLVLAIIGLMLGAIFGIGIIPSITALATMPKNSKSESVKWAKSIAILGVILSALFIISILLFITLKTPVITE